MEILPSPILTRAGDKMNARRLGAVLPLHIQAQIARVTIFGQATTCHWRKEQVLSRHCYAIHQHDMTRSSGGCAES